MVFTNVEEIVRGEEEKNKNPGSLTINEAIDICMAKLKESCFVFAYGGNSEKHWGTYSQKIPGSVDACPDDVRKRIETMFNEGKTVIIVYDNRFAEIKEGVIKEELTKLSEKPTH